MIELDGSELDQFNPEPAIEIWWRASPRSHGPGNQHGTVCSSDSEDDIDIQLYKT